jgi:hypothetical protein
LNAPSGSLSIFWEYISSSKQELYWKEKDKKFQAKLFQRAKFYCAYGYNLQLVFNETDYTLQVVGDKHYYSWMSSLLSQMIRKVDATTEHLISTQQRLFVLKKITEKISDVVRYSAYTTLEKILHVPSTQSLSHVKYYLESELRDISILVTKLNQIFPLQLEYLQHQQAITRANADLKRILQDIVEERSDVASQLHQREAERKTIQLFSTWTATKTVLGGWRDLLIHFTEFTVQSCGSILGTIVSEITNSLVLGPIIHVFRAVLSGIPFGSMILLVIALVVVSYMMLPITMLVKGFKLLVLYVLQTWNQLLKEKK